MTAPTSPLDQARQWMGNNRRATGAGIAAVVAGAYSWERFQHYREAKRARQRAIATEMLAAEELYQTSYKLQVARRGGQELSDDEIHQLREEVWRYQQAAEAKHAPRVEEGADREKTLFGAVAVVAAVAYGWRRGLDEGQRAAARNAVRHPIDTISTARRSRTAASRRRP